MIWTHVRPQCPGIIQRGWSCVCGMSGRSVQALIQISLFLTTLKLTLILILTTRYFLTTSYLLTMELRQDREISIIFEIEVDRAVKALEECFSSFFCSVECVVCFFFSQ